MHSFKCNEKAMMLVTILMLTFLLVMLTTSMILITSQSLNITGFAENKSKALQAAEAGVEYAFYQLDSDSTWGQSITSDITEHIGNGESFTIVFSTSELYYSKNNLMNANPDGTTPGYAAEIISRGTYNGTTRLIRAVFLRDDMSPCPIMSDGRIYIGGWANSQMTEIYKITGKSMTDPTRIHSNGNITLWGNDGSLLDLNGGLLTSNGTIEIMRMSGTVKKKECVLKENLPDIDINNIVSSHQASCHSLPNTDTFYLVGYFEYDGTTPAYCIPHSYPYSIWLDPYVHNSTYKLGIAAFNENNCKNFLNNYGDFYYRPRPWDTGGANRNFYKYYSNIRFYEYGTSDFTTIENELGMTMSAPDPNGNITLTANSDIYIPSTIGLYETGNIEWINYSNIGDVYYPSTMTGARVRLDLNGKKFYGNKLYLGIAPYGTTPGNGIVSRETVDLIHSYNVNMIVLSQKSVRIAYQEKNNPILTYNGIIYARDSILIQENSSSMGETLNFNGSMISRHENNCDTSPQVNCPFLIRSDSGIYIEPIWVNKVNISLTTDGIDTLVSLRGNNFKVRKQLYQILK